MCSLYGHIGVLVKSVLGGLPKQLLGLDRP